MYKWIISSIILISIPYFILSGNSLLLYSDIIFPLLGFVATSFCFYACSRVKGKMGMALLLIAIGTLFWSLGELAWSIYELILGIELPYPSWADIFYLLEYPFEIVGIGMVCILSNLKVRLRDLLLPIFISLLVGNAILYPIWICETDEEYTPLQKALDLTYPILDLILLSLACIASTSLGMRSVLGFGFFLYLISAIFGACADLTFTYLDWNELYFSGHPMEILWLIDFILVCFAMHQISKLGKRFKR